MATINTEQPMREVEQDICKYLNETLPSWQDAQASTNKQLQTNIDAVQTNLDAEVARAKGIEKVMGETDADLYDRITNEVDRATKAENELDEDVQSQHSQILALQDRCGTIEKKFPVESGNIADKAVLVSKLSDELQSLVAFVNTLPDMEFGYLDVGSLDANSTQTVQLEFTTTKTEAPFVFCTLVANSDATNFDARVKYTTTTGATFLLANHSSNLVTNVTLDYLVISGR